MPVDVPGAMISLRYDNFEPESGRCECGCRAASAETGYLIVERFDGGAWPPLLSPAAAVGDTGQLLDTDASACPASNGERKTCPPIPISGKVCSRGSAAGVDVDGGNIQLDVAVVVRIRHHEKHDQCERRDDRCSDESSDERPEMELS